MHSCAFKILFEASNKNFDSQARAHSAAQRASLGAQSAIAQDAYDKAKADQKSATFSFASNLAAVGTSFALGQMGSGASKSVKAKETSTSPQLDTAAASQAKAASQASDTANESYRKSFLGAEKESKAISDMKKNKEEAEVASSSSSSRQDDQIRRHKEEKAATTTDISQSKQDTSSSTRAGIYAASTSSAQLITSAGEAVNQNLLYGADSHHAEVQQKLDELGKSIADTLLEGSKTNKEKSAKMLDDALAFLKQHFEMVKATNDRIGS